MRGDCPKCGQWSLFPESHQCPPEWRCWEEENETAEDGSTVRARCAETAAEKYAEEYDSEGDYMIVHGTDATICVRAKAGGDVERFQVSGEVVPQYHARKLGEKGDSGG
jgi:hypothetical protein